MIGTPTPRGRRAPATEGGGPPRRAVGAELDALFADLHGRGLFDGAVVAGDTRGVVWEGGFGLAEADEGIPFTPDTPADGASLAKTFTAALVFALEAEGSLHLDEPVRRHLPELPYDRLTLRHLLSHSSGLVEFDALAAFLPPEEVRTTEGFLRILAERTPAPAFEPGAAFEYHNLGFDLAALAAARAAGSTYEALLCERFFEPLGLTSAFLRPGRLSEFPGVRTRGYRRVEGRLEPNDVFDLEGFHGGSNLYLSARDLHRWNRWFLSPERPGAGPASAFAAIGGGRSGLTLGSWYRAGESAWYSGHLQGFHSEVFRDERAGWSLVYVSNNTMEPWLQKALVRAMHRVALGDHAPALEAPATVRVDPARRAAVAGPWEPGEGSRVAIRADGQALSWIRDGLAFPMYQVDPRAFYVPGLDLGVGFGAGPGGPVARIHVSSNVRESWGVRAESPSGRRPS